MRWRKTAAFALALALAASASACITYERYGPVFTPSPQPAPGYAVVYIYRPTKAWGAAQSYVVMQGDRKLVLYAGAYGVLVVPEGKGTFLSSGKEFAFEASRDKPIYVRAEFDSLVDSWNEFKGANWTVAVVSEAEAREDLAEIGLAPGGRGRYLGDAPPPASASVAPPVPTPIASSPPVPSSTASAPPPTIDPTVDTILLKDGSAVVGDIIDEDAKAVSIMLKDGHGKVVPKSTVDRVVRRTKK